MDYGRSRGEFSLGSLYFEASYRDATQKNLFRRKTRFCIILKRVFG